jgi:hypothetical protein
LEIVDVQGGIDSVYWTVYGKISRIKKSSGTVITYTYDAFALVRVPCIFHGVSTIKGTNIGTFYFNDIT